MLAQPLSSEWILTPLIDGPVVLVALVDGGFSLNPSCTWERTFSFLILLGGAVSVCRYLRMSPTVSSHQIGCLKRMALL
jgi:hypothetical protein